MESLHHCVVFQKPTHPGILCLCIIPSRMSSLNAGASPTLCCLLGHSPLLVIYMIIYPKAWCPLVLYYYVLFSLASWCLPRFEICLYLLVYYLFHEAFITTPSKLPVDEFIHSTKIHLSNVCYVSGPMQDAEIQVSRNNTKQKQEGPSPHRVYDLVT